MRDLAPEHRWNAMYKCVYCGQPTRSIDNGAPLCMDCLLDPARRDEYQKVQAALVQALSDATLQAEIAQAEFNAIVGDIPSGLPHPDGTQRIHNASRALAAARDETGKAHNRLTAFEISALWRKERSHTSAQGHRGERVSG